MQALGLGVVRSFVPDTRPIGFRTAFALQWLVGGLPIFVFFLVPEYVPLPYPLPHTNKTRSPTYLLLKGHQLAAHKSLLRIFGPNSIDARQTHLQSTIQRELSQNAHSSYLDCFKGTDLKRTLTVCLLMFGNGLIGSAFLTQNIYFLTLAGLPVIHCFDINIAGFCLALLVIPCSWYFGDRLGRRPLYLIGVGGNAVGMAVVGGLGYAEADNKGAIWALAVLMNLLITWQLFTCFMISFSMSPEISSYKLRQPTQSISIIVQAFTTWLFAFCTPYMYNVGAGSGNLGAKTGFVFMGSSIILFVLAYFWIPETHGLTTEELDGLYENKVGPRKFGKVSAGQTGLGGQEKVG